MSDTPPATYVFGFHSRDSVEGVKGGALEPYDDSTRLSSRITLVRQARRPA